MTTQIHEPQPKRDEQHLVALETYIFARFRLTVALTLIALGGVFLLGQGSILDYSTNWWAIFIVIPGVVTLASAIIAYREAERLTLAAVTQAVIGIAVLMVAAILIWDPTWSFTHGWQIDRTFPFLRNMGSIWPWLLVVPGIGLIYVGVRQGSKAVGVLGGALCLVGGVFILNISWDVVWPLMIAALGVWLLFFKNDAQS